MFDANKFNILLKSTALDINNFNFVLSYIYHKEIQIKILMLALFKIEKPFVFTALIYVWGSSPNVNQSFFVCWMIKIWGSWLHRNRQSAS